MWASAFLRIVPLHVTIVLGCPFGAALKDASIPATAMAALFVFVFLKIPGDFLAKTSRAGRETR